MDAVYDDINLNQAIELSYQEERRRKGKEAIGNNMQLASRNTGLLSKKFNGGSSERIRGGWNGKRCSSSLDALYAFEDEEIDLNHAVELSLEEHRKGKKVIDESYLEEDEQLARVLYDMDLERFGEDEQHYDSYLEEDEQIARALQESMDLHLPADHEVIKCLTVPDSSSGGSNRFTCAGCGNGISRGRYLNCMRRTWHPQCFRCHSCNQNISGRMFSRYKGQPYHDACYQRQSNVAKCDVCRRPLQSQYATNSYWGQKYCTSHENDRTFRCCSCHRLEPRHQRYISLGDARRLCLKCLDSAIMSTKECQPLFEDIQNFYKGLNMEVTIDFPVHLVERSALNEAVSEEMAHRIHTLPEVRGLCSALPRSVRSIRRRPKLFGNIFKDIETELVRLSEGGNSKYKVTGILVLFGFPRLLCGEILAHEMLHAWFRQNDFMPDIKLEIEEGMAQVLAHMWLEAEIEAGNGGDRWSSKGKRSPFEEELGRYFKQQMEMNTDKVYGEGFRAARRAVERYGLRETLRYIKQNQSLP